MCLDCMPIVSSDGGADSIRRRLKCRHHSRVCNVLREIDIVIKTRKLTAYLAYGRVLLMKDANYVSRIDIHNLNGNLMLK